MKQLFIFILFLPLLGCGNIIKNKQTSIDFNCPRVFFSSDDRIYIDNSISLDDITIKAEFNNYATNKKCQLQENLAVIPLDILTNGFGTGGSNCSLSCVLFWRRDARTTFLLRF